MTRAKDKTDEDQANSTSQDSAPDTALDVGGEDSEGETLDFSQVSNYDPVPPGKPYLATITKFETGKAKSGEGRTASVELTVVEPEEWESRRITRSYSLKTQSLFSVQNLLVSTGEDPEKLKAEAFVLKPLNYLGMQVVAYPNDNLYQGVTTSQIRRTAPIVEWEELKKEWDKTEEGEDELPFQILNR